MTEATRSDAPSSTSPPPWVNLHAVVDEDLCTELGALAHEAESLVNVIRDLAIRAFRASAALEVALTPALADVDHGRYPGISDGLYELFTQLSGARRLDDALMLLVDNLQAARGESPTKKLDWLEGERAAADVSWPRLLDESLEDAKTKALLTETVDATT